MTRIHDDMEQYGSIEDAEKHNEEVNRRMEADERGGGQMLSLPKLPFRNPKYINNLTIDADAHRILHQLATKIGDRLDVFCGRVLSAVAQMPELVIETNEFRAETVEYRIRKAIDQQLSVRAAASEYHNSKSADMSDMIVELCDEIGLDPEKVKSDAKNDPMAGAIAEYRSNPTSKRSQCKRWIVEFMHKNGYRISARSANAVARSQGFSKDVTNNARDAYGIISQIESDGEFYWTWPERQRAARNILESGEK